MLNETLSTLEELGTAQNRKVYARHGVNPPMYGVSFANLNKLARKIKRDHRQAEGLWNTGNHDAMVLATRLADPSRLSAARLDAWARDIDNSILAGELGALASVSKTGLARFRKWTSRRGEWVATAGWNTFTEMVLNDHGDVDDALLDTCLERIEMRIHSQPNRVRYAMNNALIAIGTYSASYRDRAIAAAKRIGPVEVDHGETSCKTPDAASYIAKSFARKEKQRKKER
ncbi:MAG: DNA alkylation repair protein [Gemmatimonadetes bacterium]|nr:DNA alkylation repair protein [Gemmatimonadota bacterium]